MRLCGLRKHLRLKPDQKRHSCDVCKKVFKSEKLIKFHECKPIHGNLNNNTVDEKLMKSNSDLDKTYVENKKKENFQRKGKLVF